MRCPLPVAGIGIWCICFLHILEYMSYTRYARTITNGGAESAMTPSRMMRFCWRRSCAAHVCAIGKRMGHVAAPRRGTKVHREGTSAACGAAAAALLVLGVRSIDPTLRVCPSPSFRCRCSSRHLSSTGRTRRPSSYHLPCRPNRPWLRRLPRSVVARCSAAERRSEARGLGRSSCFPDHLLKGHGVRVERTAWARRVTTRNRTIWRAVLTDWTRG